MTTVPLADLIGVLDAAYPPALAQSWDSVGLVCGDPEDRVRRVMFAVDATAAVVAAALDWQADVLVVHHPLLLRGVDTVGAHTAKGALLHRLIRGGCALFTAHTNADAVDPGVSDALAAAIGLTVTDPLDPKPRRALDRWVVTVPRAHTAAVRQALFDAGAGASQHYREASWQVAGEGQFRPLAGANPTLGSIGELTVVAEDRLETTAPVSARATVLAALHAAHPYEEPAYDVLTYAELPSSCGLGRIGELPRAESLREFTVRVARGLPATAWGVRAAGDPDRPVRRVAVCGGAGDSLLGAAGRAGVDVYLTADLRHHPVDEQLRSGGPALVDAAHWATEFPWCAQAADVVRRAIPAVATRVCAIRTDPWTVHSGTVED